MNSNTDGYTKLLVSGIFIMVLFMITGFLSISADIRADAVQAVMVSGTLSNMDKYRTLPCNTLSTNESTINIDMPDFLIEPEPIPEEPLPEEIEVQAIPLSEPEIVYIGRIPYDYSAKVPESEPADDDYFKDALFIGDSRMVGLFSYGGIQSYFYARVSLTIRGVFTVAFIDDDNSGEIITRTIMDTVTKYPQFKKIYIAFGLNELGWDPQVFINTYEYVIDQFKQIIPDVQIFIQEIIPVTKSVSDQGTNHVRNETVREFNELLLELAEKKQVFYLGISELFVEEDNYCIPDDVAWDGIHFNIDSCKKQMGYIRNHIVDFENVYLRPGEEPVTQLIYPEE